MTLRPNILCIDDDEPLFCGSLVSWLGRLGYRASYAVSGQEGLAQAQSNPPALVLLDWNLGDSLTVPDVCREIRRTMPTVPGIIVLTARAEVSDIALALDSGADDYITKPLDPLVLEARIRAVLRRLAPSEAGSGGAAHFVRYGDASESDSNVLVAGHLRLMLVEHRAVTDANHEGARLTAIQVRILARLIRAAGVPVSNGEFWHDFHEAGPPRLVNIRAHVQALRRRLEPLGVRVQWLPKRGYALDTAPDHSDADLLVC
jgi:DNA-binding response OmpR family regulator